MALVRLTMLLGDVGARVDCPARRLESRGAWGGPPRPGMAPGHLWGPGSGSWSRQEPTTWISDQVLTFS